MITEHDPSPSWWEFAMMFAFLISLAVLLIGCVPVRITNDPSRPVPTAPMGEEIPREDGVIIMNPQLGPAPTPAQYEQGPSMIGTIATAATKLGTGDLVGGGMTLLAGAAAWYATSQRKRRKYEMERHIQERRRLAEMPPDEAAKELAIREAVEKESPR